MENFENKLNENYSKLKDILIQSIGDINDPLTLVRIEQSVSHIIQEQNNINVRNNIDVRQAIKRYENHLRSSGRAETTIKQYLDEAGKFLKFLEKSQLLLESVSIKVAEKYISELMQERKIKNNSLSKIIVLLKVFLKHIKEEYNIVIDASKLKTPRKSDSIREVPSNINIVKILGYLCNRKEKFKFENDRDMILFKLCTFLGFRRGEIIKLNWEDIDFENNALYIRNSKGRKDRKLYFDDDIKSLLAKYRAETGFYESAVVRGKCRKRITICSLTNLISRIYKESGVYREGLCLHSLRHASGDNLWRKGFGMPAISKFFGHADIRTTQGYLHPDDEDLKRIATAAQLP